MLVSNLIIGRTLTTSRQRRLMVPAAMLMLVPLLAFGAPLGLVLSLLALAVSGLGSCFNLGRDSAFIAAAPESLRARALAIDQSGLMVVQGLGFAFWGLLAEFVAVRTTIVIAGATGLVLILALFWRPRAYQGEKV
jgi:predicted MFS family arabinose efflux permease